ncbi:MAG: hypothetical protein HY738_24395 [Bacteroidia bacterium]|nr:hypothetical protein [Bacteroidia bacterium]
MKKIRFFIVILKSSTIIVLLCLVFTNMAAGQTNNNQKELVDSNSVILKTEKINIDVNGNDTDIIQPKVGTELKEGIKEETKLIIIEEKVQSLLNPNYIHQKTDIVINNNKQDTTILEQVIIFEVLDEKGLAKEYVTHEERKIIEEKVKEYEKNKKINDRAGKIYNINSKFEVESVKEIK